MIIKSLNSPNYSKKTRKNKDIKIIVIHYTGMQSRIASIKRLVNSRSKVSCHYLIDRKGIILQLVEDNKVAWHAGKSKWKSYENINRYSIGIELVNKGHDFGYEKFTNQQLNKLIKLCLVLKKKYKIKNSNILGHSDIAPLRKKDPGEKFPWKKLSNNMVGQWYKKVATKRLSLKNQKIHKNFYKNLHKIGYRYFHSLKRNKNDIFLIKAFQRRYLPNNVTGKIDQKTYEISQYLADKWNF